MVFNERARKILGQVITLHYSTCGPVGSALISKSKVVRVSPATIRNIMMGLETGGYLHQPHTSAGRLPTDLGYRAYVDALALEQGDLDPVDRGELREAINEANSAPKALEAVAAQIRAKTRLVTFHMLFRQSCLKLKHIHLERLNKDRLLAVWVSRGGHIYQSVLEIPEQELTSNLVEKAENYLNQAFEGNNLVEIRRGLVSRGAGRGEWDLMVGKAACITNALLAKVSQPEEINYDGLSHLLDMPEFQRVPRVRTVLQLLEGRGSLIQMIDRLVISGKWLVFIIGTELGEPEMDHLSVALACFGSRSDILGCVGVVGPKRMPYRRSLQMLSCARDQIAQSAW